MEITIHRQIQCCYSCHESNLRSTIHSVTMETPASTAMSISISPVSGPRRAWRKAEAAYVAGLRRPRSSKPGYFSQHHYPPECQRSHLDRFCSVIFLLAGCVCPEYCLNRFWISYTTIGSTPQYKRIVQLRQRPPTMAITRLTTRV